MAQGTASKGKTARSNEKADISILVVDDDPLVVDFLVEYLKKNEKATASVTSGEEAISAVKRRNYDIVLVDLKMNGMDGLETIEKITEINPEIVTILMTGFPTLDSSVRAIRLGASDYILKPFKLDEVDTALGKAIHEREVRREMKNLRRRVSELESGIADKKDQIKINQKVKSTALSNAAKA